MNAHFSTQLNTGWQLKARDPERPLEADFAATEGWLAAQGPGNVYQDLLAAGHIPDPFYGLNELEVQWVAEKDWLYRLEFEVSQEQLELPFLDLCFDGLDTFATVWLNGEQILHSDNMFVPRRVSAKGKLTAGRNQLHLLFESALRKGREIEAQRGKRPSWNGDTSRLYVRKAQYHYGWDWGPVLLTAGPWKAIRLEAYAARIAELHVPVEVSADLREAIFPVKLELEGNTEGLQTHLTLLDPDGKTVVERNTPAKARSEVGLEVSDPKLWWPNEHGEQPLYTLKVSVLRDGTPVAEQSLKLGVRRLRVVQEPVEGEPGTSFYFEVNNISIFAGGANWIPDDNLLNRVTSERYRRRVGQAAEAGMNMLRVWGGGIYEDEAFYNACDELGLLVWQDFMFACGIYPAYLEFMESVSLEAEAQVKRLRHHPSIALWCGNNEDYQIAESVGIYGPGKDTNQFETLAIYEGLLPEICARLDPTRLYWRGSPYSPLDSADPTVGDRHTWEIWHGPMVPYQDYKRYEGRFVSEFGMQSLPSLSLLERTIPAEERFFQSRTLTHHNKAFNPTTGPDGHRRLAVYLADNLRDPMGLEGYIYATQFVQAEAMRYAYRDFRRRWGQPGRRAVGGALVWQLNDCWPVTSWAIIDSSEIPKPAYYTIKRELKPVTVGLASGKDGLEVWGTNSTTDEKRFELELKAFSLEGQELKQERREVRLEANATTELGRWNPKVAEPAVYAARLLAGSEVQARTALWPEPFKFYRFPDPGLKLEPMGGNQLRPSVERPTKGVFLEAENAVWDDNFLDLMPGDEQVVTVKGLSEKVRVSWHGGQTVFNLASNTLADN